MPATGAQKTGANSIHDRWLNLLRLLVQSGTVLYVFSRLIPSASVNDYPVKEDLDDSWTLVLHEAFHRHLQFGSDLVFTYGPWGFLSRGYYPATYLTSVIIWGMLALVFLIAGRRLAQNLSTNPFIFCLWMVGLAAVASTPLGNDFDVRLDVWVVMLLCLHFYVEQEKFTLSQALLAGSLGCLALVKFTGLVETGVVLSLITANDLRHRRVPWNLLIWLAALFSFWLLAGQHLGSFWMYLHNSWQITSGYSDAMARTGQSGVEGIVFFLSIALTLVVLAATAGWGRLRFWGLLPVAGLGAILFIAFKFGHVRHDFHELASAMALLAISLLLLAVAWREGRAVAVTALSVSGASAVMAVVIFNYWLPGNGLPGQLARTLNPSNWLAPVAASFTGYLRDDYEKNLARIKENNPLPSIKGTTDLYSYDQAILFAHGLRYQPRPIIQSYSAFTPELARLNAAWLQSDHAASNVLFAIQPIDDRFPPLDDGLSWPELLTRFDLQETSSNKFLLLTRSAVPRPYHLIPLISVTAGFGENVTIPAATNDLIWAELEINKSLMGKVISTLYKSPMLFITVTYHDRQPDVYRLVPGMARAGFLLSPVITGTQDFVSLATPGHLSDFNSKVVTSIKISEAMSVGSSSCFEPSFQFHFSRLDFSPR